MSSGGGISRFASRKQPSSNGETSTSVAQSEYNPIAETNATKFSFGFNENSDTLSTASDDEFGFLGGGGGNSIGGDDFFMGGFDAVNGDYSATTTTENTPIQNGGIALFRGRTVTVPSITSVATTSINQRGKADQEMEPFTDTSPNSLIPASRDSSDKNAMHDYNSVVGTRMIIAPHSTPDGRILPMPVHPSVVTPQASTSTLIEQYESSENGLTPTATARYLESPNVEQASHTMGPPPNRHSSTITPTENIVAARISTQTDGTTATKLFVNEGLPFSSEKNSVNSTYEKQTSNANESGDMTTNDHCADSIDTNKMNDDNSEDFEQHHQQFVTMIRDLRDMDKKFQDMMFDGALHVDVATALLLQLKCNTYEVTDLILEQLDCVNVALREFLPECEAQE